MACAEAFCFWSFNEVQSNTMEGSWCTASCFPFWGLWSRSLGVQLFSLTSVGLQVAHGGFVCTSKHLTTMYHILNKWAIRGCFVLTLLVPLVSEVTWTEGAVLSLSSLCPPHGLAQAAWLLLLLFLLAYRLYTVVPRLVKFVDVLTNWYVRMNRRRLKVSASSKSKIIWSFRVEGREQLKGKGTSSVAEIILFFPLTLRINYTDRSASSKSPFCIFSQHNCEHVMLEGRRPGPWGLNWADCLDLYQPVSCGWDPCFSPRQAFIYHVLAVDTTLP